jgi:L-ascorbate metabolism protein UlaG (beta-lactamase superfamily)
MEIICLGHSSFRIKGKKTTLVTDPYDEKVGFKFPRGVAADIVTVSHDHHDHNQAQLVKDVKKAITGPGEYEIGGTSIIGIASFHDDQKGSLRGPNTIYVIEMDGMRLVHLGDLGHTIKTRRAETIGEVDILMIPVGGEYTIGPKQAVEVVAILEPKVILPMHYQTPGLDPTIFGKLVPVEDFVSSLEVKSERVEKLKISASDLPQEEQVIYILTKK